MVRRKRCIRSAAGKLNGSTGHVGHITILFITLNNAADVSDVMDQASQDEVGIVLGGSRTRERTPDQDVMASQYNEHGVLNVVIKRIAVADAFQCQPGRER